MERISFDQGWEFSKEPPALFYIIQGMMGGGKKTVDLPHDIDISEGISADCPGGPNKGWYKGNLGTYTKYFDVPNEWHGKRIAVEFGGIFCNSEIFINGHKMAFHPYGYSPFVCDLTKHIKYGAKNRLSVFVNNSMQNTARWYSGSGIYRRAYLLIGEDVHLSANPVFAYTERLDKSEALVTVDVEVENHSLKDLKGKIKVGLFEDKGRDTAISDKAEATGEGVVFLPENGKGNCRIRLVIPSPKVWDIDDPNLYRIKTDLIIDGSATDSHTQLFGIRTIHLDHINGLRLNGKTVKIKGGCVHHDNGILGAASFYDSEYRRMKLHKDNGYNGIRCAHNPMSEEMMEACDRLGLLVFAEVFDVWNMQKNVSDYHHFFNEWWESDMTSSIVAARNHPSIFCWSIGNEVDERNGLEGGAKYAAKLSAKVRELDPTRFVTAGVPTMFSGLNDDDTLLQMQAMRAMGGPGQNLSTPWSEQVWPDRTESLCAPLDFVGYNYMEHRYEKEPQIFPNRIICGTESFPNNIDNVWSLVEKLPHVIGDFTWVSHDYIGETGCGFTKYLSPDEPDVPRAMMQPAYPARTSNCGDFDITGCGKPSLHYRKIVWGSKETYIAVMNPSNYGKKISMAPWAWEDCENSWYRPGYENKPIEIEVYSAAEEVELFLNKKSIGKKTVGKNNRFKARFDTIYNPGELLAVSYVNGKEVSRQNLITPGKANKIVCIADKKALKSDGQSLAFVEINIVDDNGQIVPESGEKITAKVSGSAYLAALGSAAAFTEENYTTGEFTVCKGRLLAIVRSCFEAGKAELIISSEKFGDVKCVFDIV